MKCVLLFYIFFFYIPSLNIHSRYCKCRRFDQVHYPIHTYGRTIACLCDGFKRLSELNRREKKH